MTQRISTKEPLNLLLEKISSNRSYYKNAVIRAIILRENNSLHLYLAHLNFLHRDDKLPKSYSNDYGSAILLEQTLSIDEAQTLLKTLPSGIISMGNFENINAQGGFENDCYEIASRTRYGGFFNDWPAIAGRFGLNSNINFQSVYDPLIKPGAPAYPDVYEACYQFFTDEYKPNQNTPITFMIIVPDYRSRISTLELAGNSIIISVDVKEIKTENLIVKLFCKRGEHETFTSDDLILNSEGTCEIEIPFISEYIHSFLIEKNSTKQLDWKIYGKWYTDRTDGIIIRTSKDTIEGMITKGENQHVEFKLDIGKADEFLESIVSFANTDGGTILLGIHDNGQVLGISDDYEKLNKKIHNLVANRCEPDIEIDVKSFQIDTRTIIATSVKEGKNKPYLLMGKSAYKRVMKDDYTLSRHDFDEIYSNKQQPRDESGFSV